MAKFIILGFLLYLSMEWVSCGHQFQVENSEVLNVSENIEFSTKHHKKGVFVFKNHKNIKLFLSSLAFLASIAFIGYSIVKCARKLKSQTSYPIRRLGDTADPACLLKERTDRDVVLDLNHLYDKLQLTKALDKRLELSLKMISEQHKLLNGLGEQNLLLKEVHEKEKKISKERQRHRYLRNACITWTFISIIIIFILATIVYLTKNDVNN